MSIDAMKQALTALERGETQLRYEAITVLRKTLAQPEQEPVAWYHPKSSRVRFENPNSLLWIPLYPAPRQWQGLTEEEKSSLVEWAHPDIIEAIELKLRERNT